MLLRSYLPMFSFSSLSILRQLFYSLSTKFDACVSSEIVSVDLLCCLCFFRDSFCRIYFVLWMAFTFLIFLCLQDISFKIEKSATSPRTSPINRAWFKSWIQVKVMLKIVPMSLVWHLFTLELRVLLKTFFLIYIVAFKYLNFLKKFTPIFS